MSEILNETRESVRRMQEFDTEVLPRQAELGQGLSFRDAVKPAQKLISLYKQLSLTVLDDIPDNLLTPIKGRAQADYSYFQQILDFKLNQDNPTNARNSLVAQITNIYPTTFKDLYHYISYGASKSVDFQRMETDARSAIQSITDHAKDITKELEQSRKEANDVLEEIRSVAAEEGVSQQAVYFKKESKEHGESADKWRKATIWLAVALGVYSISTLFIHKIPLLTPDSNYESVQLVASKFLIFAVLSYMLFLSAKNFLSHKHNAIVNKHRQNALMTFKALVDASGADDGKEVILTHASACIFSPQDTGYVKSSSDAAGSKSIVELLPKAMIKVDG